MCAEVWGGEERLKRWSDYELELWKETGFKLNWKKNEQYLQAPAK